MVDKEERFKRVHGFMSRNAHIMSAKRHLEWVDEHPSWYSSEELESAQKGLQNAYAKARDLTTQCLEWLENGVINQTTKGIWLSYRKQLKRLPDLFDRSRQYIMSLETGEQFLIQRDYIPKEDRRSSHFLKKIKIIKRL